MTHFISNQYKLYLALIICFFVLPKETLAAPNSTQALNREAERVSLNASTQEKVEIIDDQILQAKEQARTLEHDIRLQSKYQERLTKQLAQLSLAFDDLESELNKVRQIKVRLSPLLDDMLNGLRELIAADLPFHLDQRLERVNQLQIALENPTLNQAQKLESILIAYQTEIGYGNRVESWQGRLDNTQEVTFLSVGRIGYYYLTLDHSSSAVWQLGKGWVSLSEQQTRELSTAVTQTNNGQAPSIITVPKAI